jgi:hypothetical protein
MPPAPILGLLMGANAIFSFALHMAVTNVKLVQVGDKVTCRISEIGTFSCTLSEADSL